MFSGVHLSSSWGRCCIGRRRSYLGYNEGVEDLCKDNVMEENVVVGLATVRPGWPAEDGMRSEGPEWISWKQVSWSGQALALHSCTDACIVLAHAASEWVVVECCLGNF